MISNQELWTAIYHSSLDQCERPLNHRIMEDKTMGAFTICHLHNSHTVTDVYIQPSLMSILYAFMDL